MATSGVVGAVAGLWRFPVKSMRGERLEQAELTELGLVGDRAYALIDAYTGKVVSAKSVKLFPGLFGCRAAFVEPPRSGGELPPVRITLPDGMAVTSNSSDVDRVLSTYFRREVTLARAAPDDFAIDQYHPDVEDVDPAGYRDTVVDQKLGSAFFAQAGLASPVPIGSFMDLFPLSILTTSTLEQLSELRPQSRFDQRRFRMNVIVDAKEGGFVENDWIGHQLAIGNAVRLSVALPDPRCVMTTLAQEELPKDTDVLRTLTRHNRVQVGAAGLFPCAGVYAVVEAPGTLRVGDRVALPGSGMNSAQATGPGASSGLAGPTSIYFARRILLPDGLDSPDRAMRVPRMANAGSSVAENLPLGSSVNRAIKKASEFCTPPTNALTLTMVTVK